MRKAIFLTILLLSITPWLAAQAGGPASNNIRTVAGCLRSSGNHYKLVADNGNVYELADQANELGHYVGQQVRITGEMGVQTPDITRQGAASSVAEQPVFRVRGVQSVATTCTQTHDMK